jgi:phosphatidylglycerophosphate synthase
MSNQANPRREVKTRNTGWAQKFAGKLAASGIRPNTISILSILFAAIAGGLLAGAGQRPFPHNTVMLILAAVAIQLRLLCNLFDGMVAVEGGLGTPAGILFNDFPDRIADPLILICAGYAARSIPHAVELGWLTGCLAIFTAYVRVLAGASGAQQLFLGPMAKQHRLALITVALVAAAIAAKWNRQNEIIVAALALISTGCVITSVRRLMRAAAELEHNE